MFPRSHAKEHSAVLVQHAPGIDVQHPRTLYVQSKAPATVLRRDPSEKTARGKERAPADELEGLVARASPQGQSLPPHTAAYLPTREMAGCYIMPRKMHSCSKAFSGICGITLSTVLLSTRKIPNSLQSGSRRVALHTQILREDFPPLEPKGPAAKG